MLRALFMTLTLTATSLVFSTTQASANECMRLWVERNGIFHNRGYCFGGALGKSYFGNAGCTTKSPNLSSSEKSRVGAIKRREGALNCAAQKSRWSASQLAAAVRGGSTRAPAPAPQARSCVTTAELYFNVPGRLEIARDLQVNGPWYVNVWSTKPQAFLNAQNGKCVGGTYNYVFVAEFDDLGSNPVRTYTGSISISDYTRKCEVSITERGGDIQLFCQR